MPIIPKNVLEDIRLKNDIVELIGSYIELKRAGSRFRALCPFHKEKTPSFFVHPQRQIFHCFGCGAGGDAFKFMMQYEGVDFVTAVRMLADRAGVPIVLERGSEDKGPRKDVLYEIHARVAADYHKMLMRSPDAAVARDYLKQRAIGTETVEAFLLGYAPDRWDTLLTWARKHGYSAKQMELCGLVIQSEGRSGASSHYDRFRHRLMFPIRDEQNRVVGFSGRVLDSEAKTAKYVNSPETPLFRKGRLLYGLDKARRQILEAHEVIVCEGQIDVIRCHQEGFPTAVAPQGTATTEDQARILRRYADSVRLIFDGDTAGQDAAIRAAEVLIAAGLAVQVAALPAKEDPDSFLRANGAAAFGALLEGAKSALDFQIDILTQREDIRSEVGLMRVTRAVLDTISRSHDVAQQEDLLERAARRLNIPLDRIRDMRRMLKRSPSRVQQEVARTVAAPRPKEELALAEHIVGNPTLGTFVERFLPLEELGDPQCRATIECAILAFRDGREFTSVITEHDDEEGRLSTFAAGLQMAPARVQGDEFSEQEAVKHLILRIRQRRIDRERRELEARARSAAGAEAEELRLSIHQLTVDRRLLDRWETALPLFEAELEAEREQAQAQTGSAAE